MEFLNLYETISFYEFLGSLGIVFLFWMLAVTTFALSVRDKTNSKDIQERLQSIEKELEGFTPLLTIILPRIAMVLFVIWYAISFLYSIFF